MITVKIQQMTVNGTPNLCPECGSEAYTLDGAGFIDAFPVRGNCWQSHSWEEPLITIGTLKQIQAASTGRQRAEDIDTFHVVIGGAVLEGVLHSEVILDDLKRAATDVYWKRIIMPAIRRRRKGVKRAITQPIRAARKAAAAGVDDTVAAAKAAAIGAAWDWQTAGGDPDPDYQPEPVNPCIACDGKGGFDIESRIHDISHVTCTVCAGTGEAD